MTWLLLAILAAPVNVTASTDDVAPPPTTDQPRGQAQQPSPLAAHEGRIDADMRALHDPTLTHGEAVRAALDLRAETQRLRSDTVSAPDAVRRAAIDVERAAGDVVVAASKGSARRLDEATDRFGAAWANLRLLEGQPHRTREPR